MADQDTDIDQDVADAIKKKYGFGPGLSDQDLRDAQILAGQNRAIAGYGKAFSNLGSAIAGASKPADTKVFDQIRESAAQPAQDILQGRRAAMESQQFGHQQEVYDPNNPIASKIRDIYSPGLRKIGVDPDALSGMSLSDINAYAEKPIEFGEKLKAQETNKAIALGEQKYKHLSDAQNKLNNDKEYTDAVKQAGTAAETNSKIQEAMKNPVANAVLPVQLAREAVGGGRINDREIKAAGGSQAVLDRANQVSQNMVSGTLTPENAKWMMDMAELSARSATKKKQDAIDRHASQFAKNNKTSLDEAREALTGIRPQSQPIPSMQIPKYRPGDVVSVKGKKYTVGKDGDSLDPL